MVFIFLFGTTSEGYEVPKAFKWVQLICIYLTYKTKGGKKREKGNPSPYEPAETKGGLLMIYITSNFIEEK